MTSDTPRTESALSKVIAWAESHPNATWQESTKNALDTLAKGMADMERELSAANAERAALLNERQQDREGIAALLKECDSLRSYLAAAQERLAALVSDPPPEGPLRDLGAWLANKLDADDWNNCEANYLIPAIGYLAAANARAYKNEKDARRYHGCISLLTLGEFNAIAERDLPQDEFDATIDAAIAAKEKAK